MSKAREEMLNAMRDAMEHFERQPYNIKKILVPTLLVVVCVVDLIEKGGIHESL